MALLWRLKVWTPVGVGPRVIERDASFMRGTGLRLQISPNGDCREGVFTAKGKGIQIPSLSAVQFEYHDGAAYVPLFYGQVRVGGNSQDVDGEEYTLRSLALRLKSVPLPENFSAPKQTAHLTIQAILQAVIASGKLGNPSLILYDPALIPDLGFNCREIKNGNQQNAWALLEQIQQDAAASPIPVALSFGVRPDRKFFCQVTRTDNLTLTNAEIIGKTWKSPVAETPCTAILWFVGKTKEGAPLTYESVSPESDTWGYWSIPLPVPVGVDPWTLATGTYEFWASDESAITYTKVNPQPSYNAALLTDKTNTFQGSFIDVLVPGKFVELRFIPTSPVQRITVGGYPTQSILPDNSVAASGALALVARTATVALTTMDYLDYTTWSQFQTTFKPKATTVSYTLQQLSTSASAPQQRVRVSEFRAERIDTALLDGLAKFFYSVPAQEPADLESRIYRPPADLAGRVTLGNYARAVEAWEYRVSADRGLTLAALTGQADDPRALAQTALIKARDAQAVISAVTAQT